MDRANYSHESQWILGNLGVVHQVIHTVQAPQESAFPTSGRTNKCHYFTRVDVQADTMQEPDCFHMQSPDP